MLRSSYEERVADEVLARIGEIRAEGQPPWQQVSSVTYEAGPDHTGDTSITFMLEFAAEPLPARAELNRLELQIKDEVWVRDTEEQVRFVYIRYRLKGEEEVGDEGFGDDEPERRAGATA